VKAGSIEAPFNRLAKYFPVPKAFIEFPMAKANISIDETGILPPNLLLFTYSIVTLI
jgi:hypothetical protein